MRDSDERRLDAYLRGELPPSGQRELAQASLDDPELFDLLASAAVVKAAGANAAEISRRSRGGRLRWVLIGTAAAAAALVALMVSRGGSPADRGSVPAEAARPSTQATAEPAPAQPPAVAIQPIVLAARLGGPASQSTPEFRSATEASRAPKDAGVVVSVEAAEVAIDLGSLDGVVKGSELRLVRGGSNLGRVTISTVFRERARGRVSSPDAVRAGDRVEVPAVLQLNALLEQGAARASIGARDEARALATRAGNLAASLDGADGADAMNEIAALRINIRDYPEAETLLRRAQAQAAGITALRVANNLAALAALRGDAVAAESMYRSALTMAGSGPAFESARLSIEKNLQALRPR